MNNNYVVLGASVPILLATLLLVATSVSGQPADDKTKGPQAARADFQLAASDDALLKSLRDKKGSTQALKRILDNAADRHAVVLSAAARAAAEAGRTEDALFLHFALRTRLLADLAVFPPAAKARTEVGETMKLSYETEAGEIMRLIAAEPESFAKVCARFADWSPRYDKAYQPGYAFERTNPDPDQAATKVRDALASRMLGLSKLLRDKDYAAAFAIVAKYHSDLSDSAPSDDELAKALVQIRRIEEKAGLKTLLSK